ncbi:phytoene desaturase [Lutimonas saemankumensis]|uniref:phytoene desaturase family protein n=1 Tax=Lutimonas saemankumensis TaxID=483016 RepID=UPI001CD3F397|nr:phytoene desaturase family protein [Lutimonas saemankumensis]MCA0933799.1 phytoene desaturase [Lutimonas saemankumensis]
MKKNISIIGSGFASISAACYLAKEGFNVTVYEKNVQLGGRARQFEKDGFKFDMGPTWYWMPDVFERFFADFGRNPSDYYDLERLGPAYRVYFGEQDYIDISDNLEEIKSTFEKEEPQSSAALTDFLKKAEFNYEVAIKDLVYKPGLSPFELVTRSTVLEIPQFIGTIHDVAKRKFKSSKLRQIIEFPVLFLGAKPSMTPAFYSFMNFADLSLGTWYPKGGMKSVVDGMITMAKELGVSFMTNANVDQIITGKNKEVKGIKVNGEILSTELLVSGADYAHTESLLPEELRMYSEKYWQKRVMAPSSLLFYVGLDKKLDNVLHHTLFFDVPFDEHARAIYDDPMWPKEPLFYASFPSMTDDSIAPAGKEAAIFLIPLAPDLEDTEELREQYFDIIMTRLEKLTDQNVRSSILFKESYCVEDFKNDYNSYKGNAYGMANTLLQTAFLRPKLRSKKIKNLYFTGQLTVPGPGVPPSLISGKLVSDLLIKDQ